MRDPADVLCYYCGRSVHPARHCEEYILALKAKHGELEDGEADDE